MFSASTVFNTTHAGGNAHINNINGNVTYILSEDKADKIYKWLDAPDSSGNFLAAREKHHEQTGTWFIEGGEYLRWKKTPNSALWVYGTPGCGKTIICSTVIERISEECTATPTFAYAYFFFDSRNAQTDLSLHNRLVCSIIKQLCHQSAGFPAPLVDLYGSGQQRPSIKSLHRILEKLIDGFTRTYIIIDAVDECTDKEKVLACIKQLTQRKTGNLRILFSSRPERDITDQLQSMVSLIRVSLNGKLADNDIETYLDAMLSKLIRWDPATIVRVKEALITGSDGMFRWVALQISELSKCRTRMAVEDQLRNLPKDLEGMYERSLLNSPHPQDLKRFLLWLAFSARPLEPEELADVVTVKFSSNTLPSYDPDLRYFGTADMLITCSSFVIEIEAEQAGHYGGSPTSIRVIKLAHMSVKNYLVSDRLRQGPATYFYINAMLAHSLITKTCLAYLLHLGSYPSIDDSVLESLPLSRYAADYWIKHMRLGGGEDDHLSQMMDYIFSLDRRALANWVRLNDPDDIRTDSNLEKSSANIAPPLYYACIHGVTAVVQELLVRGADANERGGLYGYALPAGSLKGHDAIVRLLLEHGADVNAHGGQFNSSSALHYASQQGHNSITRLLLERGADVNARGGPYESPLQAAFLGGHDLIFRLLLDHGADVNAQGGYYGNALQAASAVGHDIVVRVLLKQGAYVNSRGGYYGNALQAASVIGHDVIVRLLLEKGADVNAQGGMSSTALQAASGRGYHVIVRLLLEHGADVNAQDGYRGNALQAASYRGDGAIVQLLLENGAYVNLPGGTYGNALQAASYRGDEAIVQMLLEKGADVNAKGGLYASALQAAALHGHVSIVRLLLEKGPYVNLQGGTGGDALQAASYKGDKGIVQLLLEKGADVNAKGGTYGTAVQAATDRGHAGIVRLLLENGADVNAQGGTDGDALKAASYRGDYAIVQLLLEEGADVNARGGWLGSALKAARSKQPFEAPGHKGRELTVKLLLEHGAIDGDSEEYESYSGEDDNSEEREIKGDYNSACSGSEEEWASAQEDSEDT